MGLVSVSWGDVRARERAPTAATFALPDGRGATPMSCRFAHRPPSPRRERTAKTDGTCVQASYPLRFRQRRRPMLVAQADGRTFGPEANDWGWPRASWGAMIATAVIVVAVLSPRLAAAQSCECGSCPANGPPFFEPGAVPEHPTQLPRNARVFARLVHFDPTSVAWTTSAGHPMPFTMRPAGDSRGTAFWLEPNAPLSAGAYVISAATRGTGTVQSWPVIVSGSDVTTPPSVTLRVDPQPHQELCHDIVGAAVTWLAAGESTWRTGGVTEVELSRSGVVYARVFPALGTFGSSDTPDCLGAGYVAGLVDGVEITGQVRMWDMAGNATAFAPFAVTPRTVRAVDPTPCSSHCSATLGRRPDTRVCVPSALLMMGLCALWRMHRATVKDV